MVTVSSPVWSTQQATLRAWRRGQSGHWHLVRGPLSVVIGYHGWVRGAQRVQSTGTTPAGRYRLPYAFGRLADPGAEIAYRRFDTSDWWPYEPRDPATYNVWQWHKAATSRWRRDKAEHLWDYQDQYAYGVVIGFNLPAGIHYSHRRGQWVADQRADTRRGGGIFLHVRGSGATAGCVAMRRAQLRWLIRWLSPTAHAQIVMGPYRYLTTL
ncbi:MAG: L,D-transpeptidase family protein [Lapillicoccus sp.]